jgi:hypothetical protein
VDFRGSLKEGGGCRSDEISRLLIPYTGRIRFQSARLLVT